MADNVIRDDFPDVERALRDPDGLLAIGGDLTPDRILSAYRRGIFPWFSHGQPAMWWSPNPRCVLEPDALVISRSLRRTLRRGRFRVTFNRAFRDVIDACRQPRSSGAETWITNEIVQSYTALHQAGNGVSVECWLEDRLAGGLYGLAIGRVFFGESMFSRANDASKVALVHLVHQLRLRNFRLLDCQVHSRHVQSLGATPIPRPLFTSILAHYCPGVTPADWPAESVLP
ncbi:MAG: leucyl/phenylalanyl-tRNA--protein transferase [Gammaproteobacteria bacterium]|nr:leucyl/phenylalanyl-tRNA--protein transferase [Gammaproteobacteria bacterium]